MDLFFITFAIFVTTTSVFFFLLLVLRRLRDPSLKRIKELEDSQTKSSKRSQTENEAQKNQVNVKFENLLIEFGGIIKQNERQVDKLRQSLIQAGYHREESVIIFNGSRIAGAIFCFILFVLLGLLGERSFLSIVMLSALVGIVGYKLPDVILNHKIRKRQDQIAASLPDTLDLLVISVEAGLGLNAAILRVGNDLAIRCPPVSQELIRVNQDIRTGMSREEALRNLSDRNLVEDLKIFVGALILSDRLGTSIADTLRAQADSLRTRIRQKAEEKAAKASVKMLLPLVAFILPALIIILMGPGLISVYRTFNP